MSNSALFGIIVMLALAIFGVGAAEIAAWVSEAEATSQLAPTLEEVETTQADPNLVTPSAAGGVAATARSQDKKVTEVCREVTERRPTQGAERDEDDEEGNDEDDYEMYTYTVCTSVASPTTSQDPLPSSTATSQATQTTPPSTPKATGVTEKTFTMADIASHNSASSCYSVIHGTVYDLTPFVSRHPGGAKSIRLLCGVDGTTAFEGQHAGSGKPNQELARLKLGVLAQ